MPIPLSNNLLVSEGVEDLPHKSTLANKYKSKVARGGLQNDFRERAPESQLFPLKQANKETNKSTNCETNLRSLEKKEMLNQAFLLILED